MSDSSSLRAERPVAASAAKQARVWRRLSPQSGRARPRDRLCGLGDSVRGPSLARRVWKELTSGRRSRPLSVRSSSVALDMSRAVGSAPPTQCASSTVRESGSVKVRTRITPKSVTVPWVQPWGKRVGSATLERFRVSSAKREMVDPPAVEHRQGVRRRDPCELDYVRARTRRRSRSVRGGRDLRARVWGAP